MANGVEVAAYRVQKQYAISAVKKLAENTPVDVGTARSNWRVSTGSPLKGKIQAHSPYPSRHRPPYGQGGSFSETSNVNEAVSTAESRLANYKKGTIYISNNLPYIERLDDGYSPQSSGGFVSKALIEAVREADALVPGIFEKELNK